MVERGRHRLRPAGEGAGDDLAIDLGVDDPGDLRRQRLLEDLGGEVVGDEDGAHVGSAGEELLGAAAIYPGMDAFRF